MRRKQDTEVKIITTIARQEEKRRTLTTSANTQNSKINCVQSEMYNGSHQNGRWRLDIGKREEKGTEEGTVPCERKGKRRSEGHVWVGPISNEVSSRLPPNQPEQKNARKKERKKERNLKIDTFAKKRKKEREKVRKKISPEKF